jgi:hypothetical protein
VSEYTANQRSEDMRVLAEYAVRLQRQESGGSPAGGKNTDDVLMRLKRLAINAPDAGTKQHYEDLAGQIVGLQLNTFLPRDLARKVIMFSLLLGGLYGVFTGHVWCFLLLVLTLMCSPRAMGASARLLGRLSGN